MPRCPSFKFYCLSHAETGHPSKLASRRHHHHHQAFKPRGVHREVFPGGGGASTHSGSSSSSLSSLSSPTDSQGQGCVADLTPQGQGGMADLTPQPQSGGQPTLAGVHDVSQGRHMYEYGHVQSAAAVGGDEMPGGGRWESSRMSHDPRQPHTHGYGAQGTAGSSGEWSRQTLDERQPAGEPSWQRQLAGDQLSWRRCDGGGGGGSLYGEQLNEGSTGQSWQRHERPAGQALWHGHAGDEPTGQPLDPSWQDIVVGSSRVDSVLILLGRDMESQVDRG